MTKFKTRYCIYEIDAGKKLYRRGRGDWKSYLFLHCDGRVSRKPIVGYRFVIAREGCLPLFTSPVKEIL